MNFDENLKSIFLTEAEEMVSDLEEGLVSLEEDPANEEIVNQIFRAAHTIKGSAGLVGLEKIVEFSHVMENVLDRLRSKKLKVNAPLISTLLKSVDVLKSLLASVDDEGGPDGVEGIEVNTEALRRYLGVHSDKDGTASESPLQKQDADAPGGEKVLKIHMAYREDILETGQDPYLLLQELGELGEVLSIRVETSTLPPFSEMNVFKLYLSWDLVLRTRAPLSAVQNVFIFVMDDNNIQIKDISHSYRQGVDVSLADKRIGDLLVDQGDVQREDIEKVVAEQKRTGELLVDSGIVSREKVEKAVKNQAKAREVWRNTTIRVDTDKLDKLVNFVGELVIGVAQVKQIAEDEDTDARVLAVNALDQVCRDLQEQVMVIRMIPVEATFNRFKRVVRDLARGLGKNILLETTGTETELDKNVIEQLVDPLKHLLRNCVDHGIEAPEERVALGKDETGLIQLRASQQEGNIIIEIIDDGRGIDKGKVLAKARALGLIEAEEEPGDQRIYSFLFEPGFTTAEKVTDVSGRGVGLDVVNRNIEELHGSVEVFSEPGAGATFRLKLPLTLAIIEGMTVRVGSEILTIPLLSITEQIRPKPGQVKTVEGRGEVVDVRGEYLPLVRLNELFRFNSERTDPCQAMIVVLENEGRKYTVLVDEVLGQQQAVIKSLDKNFRKVEGTSGATILGDGRISLILDIHGIEKMAFRH